MGRSEEFHSSSTMHLLPIGKHRSQGPPGSYVYNAPKKKQGSPGKHAMSYHGSGSQVKSYAGPGKHSGGYIGKRRKTNA